MSDYRKVKQNKMLPNVKTQLYWLGFNELQLWRAYKNWYDLQQERRKELIRKSPKNKKDINNYYNDKIGKSYRFSYIQNNNNIISAKKFYKLNNDLEEYYKYHSNNYIYIGNDNNEYIKAPIDDQKPLLFEDDSKYSTKQINRVMKSTQNKKIIHTTDYNEHYTIQNYPITGEINGILEVRYYFAYSDDYRIRKMRIPYHYDNVDNILYHIINYIANYFYVQVGISVVLDENDIVEVKYLPLGIFGESNQEEIIYNMEDMVLRSATYLKIDYENIFDFDLSEGDNCVIQYLQHTYGTDKKKAGKIFNDDITKFFMNDGEYYTTPKNIKLFCKKYSIKMVIYNINLDIIADNYPKINKKMKALIAIAYNNHLYPTTKRSMVRTKYKKLEYINTDIDKFQNIFDECISTNVVQHIKFNETNTLMSFVCENKYYFSNPEYNLCRKICRVMGCADLCTSYTHVTNVIDKIKPLYDCHIYKSFFPYDFITSAFIHINDNFIYENNVYVCTIDKKMCYCSILYDLDGIYVTDVRSSTTDIIEINKSSNEVDIIREMLYICVPIISKKCILMKCKNIYTGGYLLDIYEHYGKNGEYIILEGISATIHKNNYANMLKDMHRKIMSGINNIDLMNSEYETPRDLFKFLYCSMIGRMQKPNKINTSYEVIKHCNFDEYRRSIKGLYTERNGIYFELEKKQDTDIMTELTHIQIKEKCDLMVFNKMLQLGINNKDIIQIKTDSITFTTNLTKSEIDQQIQKDDINNMFSGWKIEKYEVYDSWISNFDLKKHNCNAYNNNNNSQLSFFKFNKQPDDNVLYTAYAGAGKSHYIKNNIDKNDYIILAAAHHVIMDYRNMGLNCNVIQLYTKRKIIPKENNIIIDEYGLLNRKMINNIYKWSLIGKRILCFGDFNQLYPVGSNYQLNNNVFLNNFFNYHGCLNTNFRNHFTKDEYDHIIQADQIYSNKEKYNFFNKLLKRYLSTNIMSADIILCYRNRTVNQYNKLMIKKLGLVANNYIGARLICKTNEYSEKNIYNKCRATIINYDNDKNTYELNNGLVIPHHKINFNCDAEDMKKYNFHLGYAITIYGCQGLEFNKIYAAMEDIYFFNDPRVMYTMISRIKQNIKIDNVKLSDDYNKRIILEHTDNKKIFMPKPGINIYEKFKHLIRPL